MSDDLKLQLLKLKKQYAENEEMLANYATRKKKVNSMERKAIVERKNQIIKQMAEIKIKLREGTPKKLSFLEQVYRDNDE